ncbi:MAG: SAM-dependent methyltransferase, partial [Actinomycetota bacterium]|nr:SAM-dependent methyltransferase [Actinomycetota bacterium]
MTISTTHAREALKKFDFEALFIEELGWDYHPSDQPLSVTVDGIAYELEPVAEKRGMSVYLCSPGEDGGVPEYALRKRIERQVAKSAYEHIVVYVDEDESVQVWQWVLKEPGRPVTYREQKYHRGQLGDHLIQRLNALVFDIDEEDGITIVDVSGRVRAAFDVEDLTKKFYRRFQEEHGKFLGFVDGISELGDREWYASIMLNRLMFVYFIQKKGFLDGDPDYLRNRLRRTQERQGEGKFLGFYRYFLLRLFHEGLAKEPKHRADGADELLGNIPYLNGGLFEVHELEREYPDIHIPDQAFEDIFEFFDGYRWHLDERPLRDDKEINPDVLGYIFEKYINQKQMGAYYTKEDVTGYISQNTIIPYLFDAAKEDCAIAFRLNGAMWNLLSDDPDRYVHAALKRGVLEDGEYVPLPDEIRAGVGNVSERGSWNRPADDRYSLPTEIWREYVARRHRYEDLRGKLKSGNVTAIDDLVTLNIDIRQFAQDAIENCEGPELLRAFYKAIRNVSVLDPTCGSGAFLFAALNILEPLYEACLERMERFVEEDGSGTKYQDFREILMGMRKHPNRRYFVLKAIMVRNLYGVDIMEEAVEIARLRLFLKLMAQLESVDEIEPLPDVDFNLRTGNTLVGFASMEEVRRTLERKFDFGGAAEKIEEGARAADAAFERFRRMQMDETSDSEYVRQSKAKLSRRLGKLNAELDQYLAVDYGVDPKDKNSLAAWRQSHQPFHWLVGFYGVMQSGGFNIVAGNPPYVQYSKVRDNYTVRSYKTLVCKNLFALVYERSLNLLNTNGLCGLIVPLRACFAGMRVEEGLYALVHEKDLPHRPLRRGMGPFEDPPSG